MADTQTQLAVLANNLNLTAEQLAQLTTNLQTFKDQALLALDEDVARAQDGSRITRKGFELLGKALAGKELKFTRAVVGDSLIDGQLTVPTDEEVYELNELISPRFEVSLGKVTHTGGGTAAISFELKNTKNTEPIWTREFGIMAEDPDSGDEILYCYRNDGILSQCMPPSGGKSVWDIIITVYTIVSEAANITAVIDGSMNFVTPHEFDEHIKSTRPHPNIPYMAGGVSTTPALWATGSDSNLHAMSLSAVRNMVLSGVDLDFDTSELDAELDTIRTTVETSLDAIQTTVGELETDVKQLGGRATQLENNVANLFMQLDTESELGLQPNLLISEDFIDNVYCDLTSVRVTAFDGVGWCDLADGRTIIPGRWYTITDGTNSEFVQIDKVYRSERGKYRASFTNGLMHEYDVTRAQLYRTTGAITSGSIVGAGEIKSQALTFTETWQGAGANTQVTLELETNQSNANSFTITDNGTFNADGEFTLE